MERLRWPPFDLHVQIYLLTLRALVKHAKAICLLRRYIHRDRSGKKTGKDGKLKKEREGEVSEREKERER